MNPPTSELLIISYSNYFYREIARNWALALNKLGIKNYLIFSMDEECHKFLIDNDINSKLHLAQNIPKEQEKGGMTTEMGMERFKIIKTLLNENKNVIYSDLDAIWIKNPIDSFCDFGKHEILASTVTHSAAYPKPTRLKWGFTICTGWLAFKSCEKNINFLDSFLEFIKTPEAIGDDQHGFNSYLLKLNTSVSECPVHHAELFVPKLNLNILAINDGYVVRGKKRETSFVAHPVSAKLAQPKKDKLIAENLWFA
jgi:hypothetical protein